MKFFLFFLIIGLQSVTSYGSLTVQKINAFSLTKNNFQTFDFTGSLKTTVVIFLSKDCPCSKGNLNYVNKLARDFKDFTFIGIHAKKNTKAEEIITYLKDQKLDFEILNDSDLKITDQFEALKTPHVFIINNKGEVIYNGGVTNSTFPENSKEHYLRATLDEIRNNQVITHPETRTLGCFIVR